MLERKYFFAFSAETKFPIPPTIFHFLYPYFPSPLFLFLFRSFLFLFSFSIPLLKFPFSLFSPLPIFWIFLFVYQACPRNTRRGSSSTQWRGTLTASMTSAPRRMQAPSLASKKRKPRRYRQRRLPGLPAPRPKRRHMKNQKRWMQLMTAASVAEK